MVTRRKSIDDSKCEPLEGIFFPKTTGIEVELLSYTLCAEEGIYRMLEATEDFHPKDMTEKAMRKGVEDCLSGGLQSALESVSFTFGINNISRACTHQLVRTRVGATFSQQSMRWRNMNNFNVRIPESILENDELCVEYENLVQRSRWLYDKMVDADIPYEDARFVCPIGTTTHIVVAYNYRALKDVCANRMCNLVQWEIREVANLMAEKVKKVSPLLGDALKCRCDNIGKCAFGGWDNSCGKYPVREWESGRE